jgi:hypothetical protein
MAFDSSSVYAKNLVYCSQAAYRDTYGIPAIDLAVWEGLATHSPLTEQTVISDYRVVAKGRYEANMEPFADIYGCYKIFRRTSKSLRRVAVWWRLCSRLRGKSQGYTTCLLTSLLRIGSRTRTASRHVRIG